MNKLINIKKVLKGFMVISIYKFALLLRKGYWYIARPTTKGARLIILKNGKILLVKHSYDSHWYFPGGGVKNNEDPIKAVRREIMEELGIDIESFLDGLELFGIYKNEYEYKKDFIYVYCLLLDATDSESPTTDVGEVIFAEYFDLSKLPNNVSPGTKRRINELLDKKNDDNYLLKCW